MDEPSSLPGARLSWEERTLRAMFSPDQVQQLMKTVPNVAVTDQHMMAALATLDGDEPRILKLRYGLGEDVRLSGWSLANTAEILHTTEHDVSRIEAGALPKFLRVLTRILLEAVDDS